MSFSAWSKTPPLLKTWLKWTKRGIVICVWSCVGGGECSDESGTVFKVPVSCVTACLSSLQLCQSGLFNIWWQRQEQGQGPRFWFHLLQGCLPPASLRGNDCLVTLPALASSLCDTFISPPAVWQPCVSGRAEPPLISVPAAMSSVRLNDASWQPDQCANKLGF